MKMRYQMIFGAALAALVALLPAAVVHAGNTNFLTERNAAITFPISPPNRATSGPGAIDNMVIGASKPAAAFFTATSIVQGTPATLNATGTLTAAQLNAGIITSTSAAAVAATLPLGTAMDTGNPTFGINSSLDFYFINTGVSTVTMTAATGFTIVGTATVLTLVSAHFRAVRTAAGTWVLYRMT